MTKIKLHAPVAEMHGEFEKNSGIIMRQKKYRAPNGAVLKVGVSIAHPTARSSKSACRSLTKLPIRAILTEHPHKAPNSPICALSGKSAV